MKEEDKGRKLKVGFGETVELIVRIAWTLSLVKEPQLDLDYLIADDDDDSKSGLENHEKDSRSISTPHLGFGKATLTKQNTGIEPSSLLSTIFLNLLTKLSVFLDANYANIGMKEIHQGIFEVDDGYLQF